MIANEHDRPALEFELQEVVRGIFRPDLFLDYIRYFVLFEPDGESLIKKIAGYHQFHGVREAVRVTLIASATKESARVKEERATYGREVVPGSHKAGVFWHTQGSGKSISMCCYAMKLLQQPEMNNPTLVVVTDRLLATLAKYHNRAIETAQVIEELIAMAKDFQKRSCATRSWA